jgi:hypothetical protein
MPLCPRCGLRKAKRPCPALGRELCNLCCGLIMGKEAACPPLCAFRARHESYQAKRVHGKQSAGAVPEEAVARDELLGDERLSWLLFQTETPIRIAFERTPSLSDAEVLSALDDASAKIVKGRSRLIVPGENLKPANELGEAVMQSLDSARWEASVLLATGLETYGQEEKLRSLDRIRGSVRAALAHPGTDGRLYLRNLAERFARVQEYARNPMPLSKG